MSLFINHRMYYYRQALSYVRFVLRK